MPTHLNPSQHASISQDVDFIYADDTLLVLNKPAGLLSVPGRGIDKQDCLSARVQCHFPEALVVHRLDMATSGLLLMARSAAAQLALNYDFSNRRVEKRYVAIVDGHLAAPAADWGMIDLPIGADWLQRPLRQIDPLHGKPSQTRWRVLDHMSSPGGEHCTRVELEPLTGRTHQLRVHLQALGHPILGDALYASQDVHGRSPRLLLHASSLRIAHPLSTEALLFTSPPEF